ncbi:polysaccharide deacetylase family protein [Aureimonas fodinaquatilis]|nr:polysaccharide deacetylase family protein [Aureimonas fodinaquatilis]
MAYLAKSGRAVSLAEVEAFAAGNAELKCGSVLVTFDDGDPTVRTIAMPILQRYGIPSVVYALSGQPKGFDLMSFSELREIQTGGITIGSHSISHRSFGQLSRDEALQELVESKSVLENELGVAINSFAYPFGTKKDITPQVVACVREAGYTTAFSSLHGPIVSGSASQDLLNLPRVKVESGDPAWLFPALCDGAMDGWRIVDTSLAGLQKPAEEHREAAAA